MIKIFALINSDSLAIPSLLKLREKGTLMGIGVIDKSSDILVPKLKRAGIDATIYVLDKKGWVKSLQHAFETTGANTTIIFTFPWIIPSELIENRAVRFYNVHFGLLPAYRGADPIFWQIKNQEEYGGISVHQITEEIDAGPIVLKKEVQIRAGETYGFFCHRLGLFCAEILDKILQAFEMAPENLETNNRSQGSWWNKPVEVDLTINWETMEANEIEWLVNATNPKYAGAITSIGNTRVLIKEVTPVDFEEEVTGLPGTIVHSDSAYGIVVACLNSSFLRITIAELNEGIVSGVKLFNLGLHKGHRFDSPKVDGMIVKN
ncbi:methionyl-tRNA formyltransferase [Echinicola salinicaeni]|uniref:methionyl-tRNA formyltransferase n=1 Tax=Echinicola salinicaeni TaxID=2762757 RepID=UPI001645E2BB|nr:formyltransferase family protein [Echinicola salinicaeni]